MPCTAKMVQASFCQDEAREYVYNALEEFAANNDSCGDDSMFQSVRTIQCLGLIKGTDGRAAMCMH